MSEPPSASQEGQTFPSTFGLCERSDTPQDGSLKVTEILKEGEKTYWLSKTSSYDVSVKECLKIDGLASGPGTTPMTLFVMQFDFHRERIDVRIESINACITFEDVEKVAESDKITPTVVALVPCGQEKVERTTEDRSSETTLDAHAGGNAFGAEFQGGVAKKWSSSYAQQYFQEIEGWVTKSTKDRREHGAKWTMFQNSSQKFGVSPVVKVGVLVRRNQPGKWNAFFELKVTSQFWEDVKQALKRAFQITPDKTMIPLNSTDKLSTHSIVKVDNLSAYEADGELAKLLQQL